MVKDKGVYKKTTGIFDLFYNSMRGISNFNDLDEEERIISGGVKNEFCLDGKCYKIYKQIKSLNKSKRTQELINLYEQILKIMCEEMFFNGVCLGSISKVKLNKMKKESA